MLLGRLLRLVGPETTVILLSDHGFHPDHLRPRGIPKEPAGPAIEHRELGIIVMAGPHIRQGEHIYGASLLDVAPTLLTLFGLPYGVDMDGLPLITAFDKPVQPDGVASWEEAPGATGRGQTDSDDPWAEQAVIDQLVALGYIEPPGEDQQKAIERTVRESRYYLARVHLSMGRTAEALPLLEKLYAAAPDQRRYALRLAQAYRDTDRLADCRRVVEAIIEREETRFPALDLLEGTLLLAEERPAEALACFRRAEAEASQRQGVYQRLGDAYLQLEDWAAAERAFGRALAIDPENAAAHRGLARALLAQDKGVAAVDAALRSVEIRYFQPRAHFLLGQALQQIEAYDEAAAAYQVAVAQAPGMAAAHVQLAQLYAQRLDDPIRAATHRGHARDIRAIRTMRVNEEE
jgi:tetratricopeptide (TPR) repeat protein